MMPTSTVLTINLIQFLEEQNINLLCIKIQLVLYGLHNL